MHIRPATSEDADALTDLHLDVWDEAYAGLIPAQLLTARRSSRSDRVERWHTIIASLASTELVAEDDQGLQGFTSVGPGRDAPEPGLPTREVRALYVRASHYGRGVGHALLEAGLGSAAAYLWVLEGNARAIGFYERHGFRLDGHVKTASVGREWRMVR